MRRFSFSILLVLTATVTAAHTQQPSTITVEELAARISKSETVLAERLKTIKPIMEVYAQHADPHPTLGTVPNRDEYFLGQFEWTERGGPSMKRLTPQKATSQKVSEWFSGRSQLKAEAFAAMPLPDWRIISAANHQFTMVRREFLGEVRCLVLDVAPKDPQKGFTGRIWVEDRDFAIVRFNGVTKGHPNTGKKDTFNVDSWRTNVSPGMWLPSYVYAEQQIVEEMRTIRLKGQIRFWGYDLKNPNRSQEFTAIQIGDGATDAADRPQQLSPTESVRLWEKQAEENVLDRLTKAGLLAPPGEVDKILETVIRNLQITNNLPVDPPIRARVLLTSPLESFTVGRTIVMSRGLIDVLPDEATLAMMLAHELAHITLGQRVIDSQFAFADKLMVPDDDLLGTVRMLVNPSEEIVADPKIIELLKNSPYKDKLTDAGVFLRVVTDNTIRLKNLIQPHVAVYIGRENLLRRMTEEFGKTSAADPDRAGQMSTLQLGGRIMMNPWTSEVELLRAAAVAPTSAREKNTLAVAPLIPYLRYADTKTPTQ
jgi:Peptidase family M48